ncbi:hypothetical protein ACJ72_01246 [Emergomyces africanus]|uniref:Uncharacterized protein n=1 Tax=Emergomyces africanus TaxID=1955775 RepID=A0A1B7P5T9_9EURO|nr:hypothetical protein ACJ72_01246 [Emergomyces africanus]
MALETIVQPPINRIDLSGEWNGDPTSQVVLHAKVEFVSVPNTRLPLLDLSNGSVELLQYGRPTKVLEENSDEEFPNDSSRGRRSSRQQRAGLKRIANGVTEPQNETPRTLYRKGMELSPPSTKRRLFPPSPTSTVSRMRSFDDLVSDLEDCLLSKRNGEYDSFDGGTNRSTDVSATSISENTDANSAAHSLCTARAVYGDPGAEMEIMLSDLRNCMTTTHVDGDISTICLYGHERENLDTINRQSNTCRLVTSSFSSATMTPKPDKGGVSKIPVKAQRLVSPSSTYAVLSHSSESEGNLGNMTASQSKPENHPSAVVPVSGNETPSLMPSTPRNEQFSPVKLSNTLPADLTKHRVDQESPQSPTRESSRGVGKRAPLFERYSLPQSDLGESPRHTKIDMQNNAAIVIPKREQRQKDIYKSEYVSTWLKKNECNGFAAEHSHSPEDHKENSPTYAESHIQNTAIPERSESEKPITLPSPSPSSQLKMLFGEAARYGVRYSRARACIVEELSKDFYILTPENCVPRTYTIEFDLKVSLGSLQPGGWQLLKVPGLPIDRHGGKGTVKLAVLHSSTKKKLDCRTSGLLCLERDGTGYVADFDLSEPLALWLRAVELLTSESRDNRILNHEISMVFKHHQSLDTRGAVEYTAVCALSLYQKILCADEGSIAVIISDGPGGDFEWAMERGNRDFRVDQKASNASAIGTTKIRIFCKENELDGCFRITWEVPCETPISRSWVPKLFFEKPATHTEYVPSLRSQWRVGFPAAPVIQAEKASGETTPFEPEKVVRKWEPDGLEDWGYLGLPEIGTNSFIYWCVHQLVRVVLFFMTILQELGVLIHIYLEYVPLGPMKILLLSLAVQAIVLFNQQFGRPSIESQISQPACPGLPFLSTAVQIEARLGSFSWFAREKASIVDRGVLGHIFNVVSGGRQVTSMSSEDVDGAEIQVGNEEDMQNMAAAAQPAIISGVGGKDDPDSLSTPNLHQTKLTNENNNNNRKILEPATASAGNMVSTQTSLRDRIDRFLGWSGPPVGMID